MSVCARKRLLCQQGSKGFVLTCCVPCSAQKAGGGCTRALPAAHARCGRKFELQGGAGGVHPDQAAGVVKVRKMLYSTETVRSKHLR